MAHVDTFNHAFRNNLVKTAALMPVIAKMRGQMLLPLILFSLWRRIGMLVFRQGIAGYRNIRLYFL